MDDKELDRLFGRDSGSDEEKETLKLYQPTILVAMQTNNYPAASMLRRTDVTLKDEEGTTWTTGVKIKRILDHDLRMKDEAKRRKS